MRRSDCLRQSESWLVPPSQQGLNTDMLNASNEHAICEESPRIPGSQTFYPFNNYSQHQLQQPYLPMSVYGNGNNSPLCRQHHPMSQMARVPHSNMTQEEDQLRRNGFFNNYRNPFPTSSSNPMIENAESDTEISNHSSDESVDHNVIKQEPMCVLQEDAHSTMHSGSLALRHDPSELFCHVPGRLSLLSSAAKYKVTVGEIERRLSQPECLNASVLGGILRRAKSKDGGKSLRDQLKSVGLSLPAGRRKSTQVNSLTALVEFEAVKLAKDFNSLCESDFPVRAAAEYLTRLHCSPVAAERARRKSMLLTARAVLSQLHELLASDRSPVCASRPPCVLDDAIQTPLTHFSVKTHGFGTPALVASVNVINAWLEESIKVLEINK